MIAGCPPFTFRVIASLQTLDLIDRGLPIDVIDQAIGVLRDPQNVLSRFDGPPAGPFRSAPAPQRLLAALAEFDRTVAKGLAPGETPDVIVGAYRLAAFDRAMEYDRIISGYFGAVTSLLEEGARQLYASADACFREIQAEMEPKAAQARPARIQLNQLEHRCLERIVAYAERLGRERTTRLLESAVTHPSWMGDPAVPLLAAAAFHELEMTENRDRELDRFFERLGTQELTERCLSLAMGAVTLHAYLMADGAKRLLAALNETLSPLSDRDRAPILGFVRPIFSRIGWEDRLVGLSTRFKNN